MADEPVVWTVKGGRRGEREDRLLAEGLIGGGWEALPSLAGIQSKADLENAFEAAYPDAPAKTRSNYVGQLWSLVDRMKDGDLVVLPVKTTGTVAVGRISGPYVYRSDLGGDLSHVRPVKWIATDIPRDKFDQDLLFSFGAFLTFARVRRAQAEQRILAAIEGKTLPVSAGSAVEADDEPEQAIDIPELAVEQVRQFISQSFAGHDLAELVAEILRAGSYTYVDASPPGADQGVDIFAGSGPLGLDAPHLVVQVKTGQAGVDEFRSLKGVMESFRAQQGLLVAWRGFKGTLRSESKASVFSVRLWDASDVIEALFATYKQLPDDLRSRLPLQQVWALVPPDES